MKLWIIVDDAGRHIYHFKKKANAVKRLEELGFTTDKCVIKMVGVRMFEVFTHSNVTLDLQYSLLHAETWD